MSGCSSYKVCHLPSFITLLFGWKRSSLTARLLQFYPMAAEDDTTVTEVDEVTPATAFMSMSDSI